MLPLTLPPLPPRPPARPARPAVALWRRGKVLGIDLDRSITLMAHLRMTGQLLYVEEIFRLLLFLAQLPWQLLFFFYKQNF